MWEISKQGNKNGKKNPMFAQSWVNKSIICSAGRNNFHFAEERTKSTLNLSLIPSVVNLDKKLFLPALS